MGSILDKMTYYLTEVTLRTNASRKNMERSREPLTEEKRECWET